MECKKCGAINPDEAVFCAQCGTRLDGKAPCPSCGKLNDETNAYCNFCGTRLDGKTVCKTCGAVFEGNFCPKCGAGARAAETAAKATCVSRRRGVTRPISRRRANG